MFHIVSLVSKGLGAGFGKCRICNHVQDFREMKTSWTLFEAQTISFPIFVRTSLRCPSKLAELSRATQRGPPIKPEQQYRPPQRSRASSSGQFERPSADERAREISRSSRTVSVFESFLCFQRGCSASNGSGRLEFCFELSWFSRVFSVCDFPAFSRVLGVHKFPHI